MSGLKITRLIKHVVCGQQHFALFEENFSVSDQGCAICNRFSSVVLRAANVTDERRNRNLLSQASELFLIKFVERRALGEILRRITA